MNPADSNANNTVKIKATSPNADPLTYPLLFIHGDMGWSVHLQLNAVPSERQHRATCRTRFTLHQQGCQIRDFIPRSRDFLRLMGFFSGTFFWQKISGKISGILRKNSCERKNKNNSSNNKSWPIFQTGSRPEPPSC